MGRQACGVPVRVDNGRVEFCLVTESRDSRWRFPVGEVVRDDGGVRAAVDGLLQSVGLDGDAELDAPLDEFRSSRIGDGDLLTAFLVRVEGEQDDGRETELRRRWCLPEEARMRIRRKPMRRLIDLALRRIEAARQAGA